MRIFFTYILPLLLPTALYLLWLVVRRRRAQTAGQAPPPRLQEAPWYWLILAGFALLAATLVTLALTTGNEPGGVYRPPHLEDGRVVPGRVID